MLRGPVPGDCHQTQLAFSRILLSQHPCDLPSVYPARPYIQKDDLGLDALGRRKYLFRISEKCSFVPHPD